jgi:acyl carrier protein
MIDETLMLHCSISSYNDLQGLSAPYPAREEKSMSTMNKEQIREAILRILADVIPNADTQAINPDISFHDQLELDSIDFLRLMMSLEKEMNVTIFDFDYPKLSTLKGCERYLAEQLMLTA